MTPTASSTLPRTQPGLVEIEFDSGTKPGLTAGAIKEGRRMAADAQLPEII